MKILFIVNPAAGHGRGLKRWRGVADRVLREHPGSQARLTTAAGEGVGLALRGLEEGFDALVAVGGDGTVGEAVDGYLSASQELRSKAAIGTWPAGSGCDLARHLGIGAGSEALLALLARSRIARLDAGVVKYVGYDGRPARKFFHNVAAFGIAGDVALRVKRRGKPWGGTLSYLLDSLAELARAKAKPMELVIDGEAQPMERYHLVTLANTSTFGGGMRVAPQADNTDGQLDLVTVSDLPKLKLLMKFPRIYAGSHIGEEGVKHRLVRRLEARSPETVHLNIDGEASGVLPASFEILPGAIPFLI